MRLLALGCCLPGPPARSVPKFPQLRSQGLQEILKACRPPPPAAASFPAPCRRPHIASWFACDSPGEGRAKNHHSLTMATCHGVRVDLGVCSGSREEEEALQDPFSGSEEQEDAAVSRTEDPELPRQRCCEIWAPEGVQPNKKFCIPFGHVLGVGDSGHDLLMVRASPLQIQLRRWAQQVGFCEAGEAVAQAHKSGGRHRIPYSHMPGVAATPGQVWVKCRAGSNSDVDDPVYQKTCMQPFVMSVS